MHYIQIPTATEPRKLSFYLALEEYVALNLKGDDYFFMWQVQPSVIFGRNQLIDNEVNIEYCKAHHIQMFRRKSGGGCVFADMSNVMLSYITPNSQVQLTFLRYVNMLVDVLCNMGVTCQASGRNDILIDGKKVSGAAFYHLPNRSIVHSTLLYSTDMPMMMAAITPGKLKLASKGVQSVRQRIALLEDYTKLSLPEVMNFIRIHLCTDEDVILQSTDMKCVEELEKSYLDPEFIFGDNPKYTLVNKRRVEGVGDIEARIEVHNGKISAVNLLGDYFLVGDLQCLLRMLVGVPLDSDAIRRALPQDISHYILNLQREDIVNILTTT